MSDQDKINVIIASIQSDAQLILLLRSLAIESVNNATGSQLDDFMTILGISQ